MKTPTNFTGHERRASDPATHRLESASGDNSRLDRRT